MGILHRGAHLQEHPFLDPMELNVHRIWVGAKFLREILRVEAVPDDKAKQEITIVGLKIVKSFLKSVDQGKDAHLQLFKL